MMRSFAAALLITSTTFAQGGTTLTAANQHLSVKGLASPEVISPGSPVTLTFDITPGRRMHVYAPGAEYQVITIKLDPQLGLKARDLEYPPSEIYIFEPTNETVPVYQKPFTLKQVVAVSADAVKGKTTLPVSGTIEYQACDDKVCFKPNSVPFKFEFKVGKAKG